VFFSKAKQELEPPPVHERRRSIRHATVMQIAKIRLGGTREELCLLRDVSPEGVKAEVYVAVEVGLPIEIELRTGHVIGGRIAWADDKMIGVAFDEPMPMSAMLAHCSFDDRLGKLRPPRLVVNMHAMLKVGHQERAVRIGNLSQAGLQIDAPEPYPGGTACTIALPGLAPRAATIRWWREGQAGLMLAQSFDYAEFAEWRSVVAA
jgi:hypothetical protein